MKKLLLTTAACGLAFAATPANAQVELEIGGYFRGYGAYVDQDENASDVNDFDIIRDTEIHFGGETTLDNGLTVGFHTEFEADGDDESVDVDESYAYFSGNWGRVNFGNEDGAAYLLQVAAPSADSNIDGIRQFVQPINYGAEDGALSTFISTNGGLDYDQDQAGKSDKFTYLSPILNGFQGGVSFSPDTDAADDLDGIGLDESDIDETYELALRYEGQFNNVGVIAGAGYSHGEDGDDSGDDREAFNFGLDLDIGPIGVGAVYAEDNYQDDDDEEETIVVGADYTTGPFKIGASYLNKDNTFGIDGLETDRYSAGVVYTYGPGMTFRGSIGYVEHEADTALFTTEDEFDATYVTLGTQINF